MERCGTIIRFLYVRLLLIYNKVRRNRKCSRQIMGADFEFSICFSAWVSIFCWHKQKILQKFAVCLYNKSLANVTSIALYKNFCFAHAVTYLCIILHGKACTYVIYIGEMYIHMCYCRGFKHFLLPTMHKMHVYMHLVCYVRCGCQKFTSTN